MKDKNILPDQEQIDRLILRYADGKIGREDLDILEKWIAESEDNLRYYRQVRNILGNSSPMNINTGRALENVLSRTGLRKKNTEILSILQRVAAVLFLPLIITFLLTFYLHDKKDKEEAAQYRTITAAFGTISTFELQDGSKVWLNSGSTLQAPDRFMSAKRIVKLTGEAYFEVKSDASAPFIVQSGDMEVEATGTRFSVMAFAGRQPAVTLAEGKVMVQVRLDGNRLKSFPLFPGQHLEVRKDRSGVDTETGDIYRYYAWKDGKLIFRNDLFSDIIERINLQYNVDIEVTDPEILKNRYRATFEDESLTEVLDLLKLASPFSYREISPVTRPDGSHSKRKIIISSIKPIQH